MTLTFKNYIEWERIVAIEKHDQLLCDVGGSKGASTTQGDSQGIESQLLTKVKTRRIPTYWDLKGMRQQRNGNQTHGL